MLAASVCHFYSGMPAHKRAHALSAVSGWVSNALVLRDAFALACSDLGVVRVVSSVADAKGFLAALDADGLVGVYEASAGCDFDGSQCAAVMDDVVFALTERGL